jgi:hypothetical protein
MTTPKTRLLAISVAALALVAASAASVAAQPPLDDGSGLGLHGPGMERGLRAGGAMRGFAGFDGDLVRQEVTWQTDDGIVTRRLDNGTLTAAAEGSVEYTLADGQTVSVATDEDTEVYSVSVDEDADGIFGRRARARLDVDEVAVTDLVAGSEVQVVSTSQAEGSFLASRIIVQPAETSDETAIDDSADDAMTDDASTSPAPVASPAAAASATDA